ncbi:hypothetical protein ACX80E_10095 [Arthrobacter sp. TMN-49]
MDHQSAAAGDGSRGAETEIEQRFRELTDTFLVPEPNECLICFLRRTMARLLPTGFAMTAAFQRHNAPRATHLVKRLMRMDVYSDCQLLQSGVVVNQAIWAAVCCPDCGIPYAAPDCLEVRRGSTQPCKLWRWRADVVREDFQAWLDPRY